MKKTFTGLFIFAFLCNATGKTNVPKSLDYIKNEGQWEAPVLYKADLSGGWVYLEKNALTFKFLEKSLHSHPAKNNSTANEIIKGHVYKINWLNANPAVKISETDKQPYYNNYFIGNDQRKWKSNVSLYKTILYKEIYPNIDFKIYSEANSMKSDYIIHKNGNIQDLKFQYDGADAIVVTEDGRLKITTSINTVYELKPYAYQLINGKPIEVACNYLLKNNILSFQISNEYNKNVDLIIDPTLVFSTYSGSFSDNWGSSATHDNAGNMFLGGIALGSSYPTTTGAFQTSFAGGFGFQETDIAITKFNATGTSKIYSTYLGGSNNELLASLLCTPNNELIVVLTTGSSDFPTSANAYDKTFNGGSNLTAYEIELFFGSDLAITKFNAAGSALVGSTFFGGSGNDGTNTSGTTAYNYGDESRSDVAIDNAGNIYVTTTTTSTNLPGTAGKAQATNGGGESDGLLAKFNSNLSSLSWATYYGGSGADASYSIQLDKTNNIFICGGTSSTNIPGRTNGLNTIYKGGQTDGFVAKFDNNGSSVLSATYLGTNGYDQAYIMDLDNNDNVYIFGQTNGAYPVSNGVYSNAGANQFIHELNNALNTTSFSTVFGSTNSNEINITPTALLVDVCNNIYAVGWGGNVNYQGTTDNMAVTNDAFKSFTDGSDFYLINLSANATNLKYATYFGENGGVGDHVDGGTSRFDKNGVVYEAVCASCGGSNSFPTTAGVIGPDNNASNCNMAGFKFKFDLTGLQIISATATPSTGCQPLSVNFSYTSTLPGTQWFWDFGDGFTSNSQFPSHTYTASGTFTVRFILRDPNNCNPLDSTTLTVTVGTRKNTTINKEICDGESFTVGNQTFSSNGTFNITLQSASGCDSVVTLNLTVNPKKTTPINKTVCFGESFTVGNQTFSSSGTFTVVLRTSKGCDSTVVLNLIVSPKILTNLDKTICSGESIMVGTHTYTETGNYFDTLKTPRGCDSIINLNLIVNPKKITNLQKVVCTGIKVIVGNHTYSVTGNYSDTLKTSANCDSIINLNLVVTDTIIENIERTICLGDSIAIARQIFKEQGDYEIHLPASDGCDSLIKLSLTVLDTAKANISRTICDGDSISIGTQIFKDEGDYQIFLKTTSGCDSLVNLTLNVIPIQRTQISDTICDGQSIIIGNQTFTEEGNFTIKLSSSQNCDSIVFLTIKVNPLPVIDAVSDKTSALPDEQIQLNVITQETLLYNWIPADILNNSTVQNPTAFIKEPTWFSVTATNRTTQCNTVDSVFVDLEYLPCSKENIFIPNAFSPNGDGVNDKFLVRSKSLKSMHLEIYDRWGHKVFETDNISEGWDGTFKGQPSPLEAYGYYFKGECLQGDKITLKGNVTIIR
ncbi:MAG TPA: gliding motility-associated C-terminal domain-containing protein [Chitinophagales bacterium]|nr:gliding motility-associated C-terminal domain-containing protein [Chitinophagales bacterium]